MELKSQETQAKHKCMLFVKFLLLAHPMIQFCAINRKWVCLEYNFLDTWYIKLLYGIIPFCFWPDKIIHNFGTVDQILMEYSAKQLFVLLL